MIPFLQSLLPPVPRLPATPPLPLPLPRRCPLLSPQCRLRPPSLPSLHSLPHRRFPFSCHAAACSSLRSTASASASAVTPPPPLPPHPLPLRLLSPTPSSPFAPPQIRMMRVQHLNGHNGERAPCGRGWCRRSCLRPRPKEKEYSSYHPQTVRRKEGSYLCCKGKTLKVQDLLEEEKNFRKIYVKASCFLSIHMGVEASVLPDGTDCHHFILEGLSRKDYEQKKELVANEIIGRLEKRSFPGLQDSIVLKEW